MVQHESKLTDSRPKWAPSFLREIEALSDDVGLIEAIHRTLERDNITVDVDGDFDQLQEHKEGMLFVGDHKNQWEFVALMDLLSRMGRTDMMNIAKFYVQRQVHQALGNAASRLVMPVYPRILASDRGEFFNSETLNRVVYRKHLLTTAESAEANARAIGAAASLLEEDGVVNIFPTGSVVDSRTHPWRDGVGRIITSLDDETKRDTIVAPYGMGDISKARLIGSVATRGRTFIGKPQTLKVRLGPLQTAGELTDSMHRSDRDDPAAITGRLRAEFIEHFGPTK